jgi:hypothetical protein
VELPAALSRGSLIGRRLSTRSKREEHTTRGRVDKVKDLQERRTSTKNWQRYDATFSLSCKRSWRGRRVDERVPDFPEWTLQAAGVLQGQPKRNETENAGRKMEGTYRDQLTQCGLAYAPGGPSSRTPRGNDSTQGEMQRSHFHEQA